MPTSAVAFVTILVVVFVVGIALGWFARASRSTHNDSSIGELVGQAIRAETNHTNQQTLHTMGTTIANTLTPMNDSLRALASKISDLEVVRTKQSTELSAHISAMLTSSQRLSENSARLAQALSSPTVRGRWGEMQLQRVVEIAGMVDHCDFDTQVVSAKTNGRPDMIVHLTDNRSIIVDAKVPYNAYLDALEADTQEEQDALLRRHARHLRTHVKQLASRDYSAQFERSFDFIVLFVPADPFLDGALRADPELLDYAFANNIVIATPTTLIALLRTIAMGWSSHDYSQRADEIATLGRQLYQRIVTVIDHYNKLGKALDRAVDAYNATGSSMQSRLLVTAKVFEDVGLGQPQGGSVAARPISSVDHTTKRIVDDRGEDLSSDSSSSPYSS